MNLQDKTPWYKKKIPFGFLGIFVIFAIIGLANGDTTPVQPTTQVASPVVSQPINNYVPSDTNTVQKMVNTNVPTNTSGLSNDNYYTNTYGNSVHSPAYSDTVPVGASARCRDGTYSFSQSRRGTCSHHGGVSSWI